MAPSPSPQSLSPPSTQKILEGVGLILIIVGFFVCSLFLFHSTYAFIGPVLLFLGVVLVGAGRLVSHHHYRRVKRAADYEEGGKTTNDLRKQDTSSTKGAVYTNSGYVGSQPGLVKQNVFKPL